MYPPQTSLIPVSVQIAEFVYNHGFSSLTGWWPSWYMGLPTQFITGPLTPLLLVGSKKILFFQYSFYQIVYFYLLSSFAFSAFLWSIFLYLITKRREVILLSFILFLVFPFRYISALLLSETSQIFAKNHLPISLICLYLLFKRDNKVFIVLCSLSITTGILISIHFIPIFIVASICFAYSKNLSLFMKRIRKFLVSFAVAIILSFIWFTPGYYINILNSPSIGGEGNITSIFSFLSFFRGFAPFVLAIVFLFLFKKKESRFYTFSIVFTLGFFFLTVFRFLGNPHFWQDYFSWIYELEVGFILLSVYFSLYRKRYIIILISLLIYILLSIFVWIKLYKPNVIFNSFPTFFSSLSTLDQLNKGNNRSLLSGASVFWYKGQQVRGGSDISSIHPLWRMGVYELREGDNIDASKLWLKIFGIKYSLIHTDQSGEYYLDYKNTDKWNQIGDLVYQSKGDRIYEFKENSIVWFSDKSKVLSSLVPVRGDDLNNLTTYSSALITPLNYLAEANFSRLTIKLPTFKEGGSVTVLITYDSKWKASTGLLLKDPYGNMLIVLTETGSELVLEYLH